MLDENGDAVIHSFSIIKATNLNTIIILARVCEPHHKPQEPEPVTEPAYHKVAKCRKRGDGDYPLTQLL